MTDDNGKIIEGHEYDGIKELDNPLPGWWLTTFFITIIFAFLYWIHYEFSGGQTIRQELAEDMGRIEKLKKNNPGGGDTEEELTKLSATASVADEGKNIFVAKCAACHGPQGQGLIGPNLTDDYWIHGKGKMTDIAGVVRKGVLDKGMPPWEGQLKDSEVKAVVIFVAKLHGSNPPNPKAPQGEKVVGN